jgi:hypothetical protein
MSSPFFAENYDAPGPSASATGWAPFDLLWDTVLPLEPPAEAAMGQIHGLAVHEGTAAYDRLHAVRTAHL